MPLEKFPVITQNDVNSARGEQLKAFVQTFSVAAGLTGLNYRFNAPGGPLVQFGVKTFTGVNATPTPSGRAAIRLPPVAIAAAFLPSPVGFAPPEWLGLHPAVVRRTLGFGAGKKPIIFEPGDQRKRVYEATITAERIGAKALHTEVLFGRASGLPFGTIPPGPIDVSEDELAFLESLPEGLTPSQRLIPQLRERRADLIRSELQRMTWMERVERGYGEFIAYRVPRPIFVIGAGVPNLSVQPEHIQPVNDAALRNQEAAEGIRAALVHERADP